MTEAILREKRIKKWRRAWKIMLIEEANPDWRDLYDEVLR
jgi:putative endonuclease